MAVGSRSPGGSFALLRFNPDGRLDPSFGTDGRVFSDAFSAGEGVALQPDGKIVVAGSPKLTRFRPDGSLDPTFGTNGAIVTFWARDVAIQPDGKIVVVGMSARSGPATSLWRASTATGRRRVHCSPAAPAAFRS